MLSSCFSISERILTASTTRTFPRMASVCEAHHLVRYREVIAGHHKTYKHLPEIAIGSELAEFHDVGGASVHIPWSRWCPLSCGRNVLLGLAARHDQHRIIG
jgi:hypothetical protein